MKSINTQNENVKCGANLANAGMADRRPPDRYRKKTTLEPTNTHRQNNLQRGH